MTAPVNPGCFEWCDLGQRLAAFGVLLVSVLWLLVVLVEAWSWREREPTVAAISAIVASPLLLLVALRFFDIVSYEVITDDLLHLTLVVSLGLQLPPVWRPSQRTSPSTPLRIVVAIMNLAVVIAAFALVLLGTSVARSAGPNVVLAGWVVFVGCLIAISIAAWRDGVAAPSRVRPLLAASLPILVVPAALAVPGNIAFVVFLAFPLSALAWLVIAVSWLRVGHPRMPAEGRLALLDRAE